jgi:hypothetical protein
MWTSISSFFALTEYEYIRRPAKLLQLLSLFI